MVTFICDECQSGMKRAKVAEHRCRKRSFSCVDCGETFTPDTVKEHTECISEEQRHQRTLFKDKRGNEEDTKRKKQKIEENTAKKRAAEEEEKSIENMSKKIEKALTGKSMTLRKLKKKLVKEDDASDDAILKAMFAIARKIDLSLIEDSDDE